MNPVALNSWFEALGDFLGPAGVAHGLLGVLVGVLGGLWAWNRSSLSSVRSRADELALVVESQALRLQELEGARWAADPEARARRDDELVEMLGSLLSYTESVRNGGASAVPDQEGEVPCP